MSCESHECIISSPGHQTRPSLSQQRIPPGKPTDASWTDAMSKSLFRRLQSPINVPCHSSISVAELASSPASTVPLPYVTRDAKSRPMLRVYLTTPTGSGLYRCTPPDGILLDTGADRTAITPRMIQYIYLTPHGVVTVRNTSGPQERQLFNV